MRSSAVVVMPRGVAAWPTAEALWITAKGWARAAERRFGAAWIATPDGAWLPDLLPRPPVRSGRPRRPYPLPGVLRTLAKDLRLWLLQSRFEVPVDGAWSSTRVRLVWEHHDLFNQSGRRLADTAGAPLVRYVHAPQVWEATKWGVRRPVWGRGITALELRHLRRAELVACVSPQVRDRLVDMGVDGERVVIAPMAVDTDRFSPEGDTARSELGLDASAVVVGWCGSFRPFHGLDRVLAAFSQVAEDRPELHLLLIGDGPVRAALQEAASGTRCAERVIFTGAVAHPDMPRYLRTMDVAVVSSDGRGEFHYSPLKLREYAASGRAVVAPAEGELVDLARSGFVSFHTPGRAEDLAGELDRLASDALLRARQGAVARRFALEHWTWGAQLTKVMTRLEGPGAGGI